MGVESSGVPVEPERITRNGRRFFSEAHKRAVVERCLAPGASVSAVSLAHGFNTNLVRKWIHAYQAREARQAGTLVPVVVREAPEAPPSPGSKRTPTTTRTAPAAPSANVGSIEIVLGAAKILVQGHVDPEQLRLVLDLLARHR